MPQKPRIGSYKAQGIQITNNLNSEWTLPWINHVNPMKLQRSSQRVSLWLDWLTMGETARNQSTGSLQEPRRNQTFLLESPEEKVTKHLTVAPSDPLQTSDLDNRIINCPVPKATKHSQSARGVGVQTPLPLRRAQCWVVSPFPAVPREF